MTSTERARKEADVGGQSRSVQRRIAAQKGQPAPTFPSRLEEKARKWADAVAENWQQNGRGGTFDEQVKQRTDMIAEAVLPLLRVVEAARNLASDIALSADSPLAAALAALPEELR